MPREGISGCAAPKGALDEVQGFESEREAEGLGSVCKCPNSPRAATHAVCRMNHVLTERIPAALERLADVFQVTLGEKTTHRHGSFFPGSLCTNGERGDSTFGRVSSWVLEPLPFSQGLGMLEGGEGAAKAVAGMELLVRRLREMCGFS